jgi:hypothetical protein
MRRASSFATIVCAVIAGFLGGMASQGLFHVTQVKAETAEAPPQNLQNLPRPKRVVAQRFVLVDADGAVHGEFKMNDGKPEIDLYDKSGKVFWSTNARAILIDK